MQSCGCTRRQAIRSLVGGSLLLPGILGDLFAQDDPLAPRATHFPAKAKRVIFLYMTGGVSHVDTFDPKPRLAADSGKTVAQGPHDNKARYLLKPRWNFQPHGACGTEISELFPNLAGRADDLCVIRSMKGDHSNHFEATLGIHTGSVSVTRPSFGSWVSYGLGTVNRNLPSFVVIAPHLPYAGGQVFSSDFLPGAHQGTHVLPNDEPIADMNRRVASPEIQDLELGLLEAFNRDHLKRQGNDPALAARIKSFETAFGMQREAPEAFDLSKESDETHALYGLERGLTKGFAWQCLVARRLAERGVRFIELIDTGASKNWDSHDDIGNYRLLAKNVDRPMAGLLTDLKARGMLDETLVVWATEFGRTPFTENPKNKGREHHSAAFSCWVAGGGIKAGSVYGATDEHGIQVVQNPVSINDFHATLLHLLGMDHKRLTYRHAGRDFRLTDVKGEVVRGILA